MNKEKFQGLLKAFDDKSKQGSPQENGRKNTEEPVEISCKIDFSAKSPPKKSLSRTMSAMLEDTVYLDDVSYQMFREKSAEMRSTLSHVIQQVEELEQDREELHALARKDKNLIHELNVEIHELQAAEKSLKEQVSRLDVLVVYVYGSFKV